MNIFKMSQKHHDGLSKEEEYYATPSMIAIKGMGDYKLLMLVDKAHGGIGVGIRRSGHTDLRPDIEWINFPSVEMFNIFVSACQNLQKVLPPEKPSNLFLYGYPNKPLPDNYAGEKASFDYEERVSPIGW